MLSPLSEKFSINDVVQTVSRSEDKEVTTFISNEFWQSLSSTNGERPMPSDTEN